MNVTGWQLDRRYAPSLRHAQAVADRAADVVQRQLRESVGQVEVLLVSRAGMEDVLHQNEQRLLGASLRRLKNPEAWAHTTASTVGTLIVVNAEDCPQRELTKTLVHEMVHAAQFQRPGIRDYVVRMIRANHQLDRLSWRESRAMDRQLKTHEREAARLERLAREIR
jgi:hypothetical protein